MLCKIVLIEPCFMTWEGTAVIGVVVLQNQMDLLRGELGSCSETSGMSSQVERVRDMTEEDEQGQTTTPVKENFILWHTASEVPLAM